MRTASAVGLIDEEQVLGNNMGAVIWVVVCSPPRKPIDSPPFREWFVESPRDVADFFSRVSLCSFGGSRWTKQSI